MDLYGKSRHDLDGMYLLLWNLRLLNSEGAKMGTSSAEPRMSPREGRLGV